MLARWISGTERVPLPFTEVVSSLLDLSVVISTFGPRDWKSATINWYCRFRIAAELNSSRGEIWLRSAIFPRLKTIYLSNPKVAGTTILTTLMAADGSPHLSPLGTGNSRRRLSAENDPATFWRALHDSEYLRFTFVRDPYARVVSAFLDKIDSGRHLRFKKMLGFAPDDRVLFVDFLRRVSGQEIVKMNRHWRPQSALISPKVKLDFIGRFEQFEDDFAKLLERLGVEENAVRHKREHQTSANHHLDLIGIEEKALIDRIYEEDFERFGYPMRVDRL